MDFEEFSYDTVEMIDFDLAYYQVTLKKNLILMLEETGLPTMFKKGTEFDRADFLLESKQIVFSNEDQGYEYSARVVVSIG